MERKREYFFVLVRGLSDILDFVRGFLLISIIGGAFGPEIFGTWGLIEQIYSVAVIIAGLGLSQSVIRYLTGEHKAVYVRRVFLLSSTLVLALGLLLTFLMYLAAPWIDASIIKTNVALVCLKAALPLIVLNALELLLDGTYRARLRIDVHSLVRMFYTALTLAAYLYARKMNYDLAGIIGLVLGIKFVYVLILYLLFAILEFREKVGKKAEIGADAEFALPQDQPALPALKGMLVFGAPLMMFSLSNWLLTGGKVILGFQTGAGEAGRYDASLKIAMLLQYLGMPIVYTLLPLLAEAVSKKGREAVYEVCRRFARLYFFLALPLFFGLLATQGLILDVLTGEEAFHTSMLFFVLPLLAAVVSQVNAFYHNVIFLKGNSRFLFAANFCSALFCVALNVLLTGWLGMYATAISSLLSYLLLIAFCALRVRSYGFEPLKFLDLAFAARCGLVSILMFAAVMLSARLLPCEGIAKLICLGALGGFVYFAVSLAVKKFSLREFLKELTA